MVTPHTCHIRPQRNVAKTTEYMGQLLLLQIDQQACVLNLDELGCSLRVGLFKIRCKFIGFIYTDFNKKGPNQIFVINFFSSYQSSMSCTLCGFICADWMTVCLAKA